MTHKQEKITEKKITKSRIIDRKEAIKRTGYIALSAATMMLLISKPGKANGGPISSPAPPVW